MQPVHLFFIQLHAFEVDTRQWQQVFGKRAAAGTHFQQPLKRMLLQSMDNFAAYIFIVEKMLAQRLFERVHWAKVRAFRWAAFQYCV